MRVEKIKSRNYKKDRTVLQPRYRARTRSVLRGVTTQSVGTIRVISGTPSMPMHPSLAATTDYCGRPHHVFDVTLSRVKHRTVGGGLPAMNDDAIFLTYRVDCIAGKPPPTKTCSFSRLRIV